MATRRWLVATWTCRGLRGTPGREHDARVAVSSEVHEPQREGNGYPLDRRSSELLDRGVLHIAFSYCSKLRVLTSYLIFIYSQRDKSCPTGARHSDAWWGEGDEGER